MGPGVLVALCFGMCGAHVCGGSGLSCPKWWPCHRIFRRPAGCCRSLCACTLRDVLLDRGEGVVKGIGVPDREPLSMFLVVTASMPSGLQFSAWTSWGTAEAESCAPTWLGSLPWRDCDLPTQPARIPGVGLGFSRDAQGLLHWCPCYPRPSLLVLGRHPEAWQGCLVGTLLKYDGSLGNVSGSVESFSYLCRSGRLWLS